eukprot:scaffold45355_cov57-Phaeocystis_antarctica.AAC.3
MTPNAACAAGPRRTGGRARWQRRACLHHSVGGVDALHAQERHQSVALRSAKGQYEYSPTLSAALHMYLCTFHAACPLSN